MLQLLCDKTAKIVTYFHEIFLADPKDAPVPADKTNENL